MGRDVQGLRGFFDGFFRISAERWGGFLAGRRGLPNNERHRSWWERMVFGLVFISRLRLSVAAAMLAEIVRSCVGEGGIDAVGDAAFWESRGVWVCGEAGGEGGCGG